MALALALGALGGCRAAPPIDDIATLAVQEVELPDGRRQKTISIVEGDGVEYRAVLEQTVASRGAPNPVFRFLSYEPPGAPLSWVIPLLPVAADLELEGRIEPHPDRRLLAELLPMLETKPPALESALAGLERLHRIEPRAEVLARAARLPTLLAGQIDRLVDVAVQADQGPLLGPGPGGRRPGGSRAEGLHAVLAGLAGRRDLGTERSDRVARAAPAIHRDGLEAEVLIGLVRQGSVTTEAVLEAFEGIDEPTGNRSRLRRNVLLALARRPGLVPPLGDLVARAVPTIENDGYEAEVLLALVGGRASVDAILAATRSIDQAEDAADLRARVLKALANLDTLQKGADGDRVAAAAPGIDGGPLAGEVLEILIRKDRASTKAALAAMRGLDGPREAAAARRKVALALVETRGNERVDADQVAEASRYIEDDHAEAEILKALLDRDQVSASAVLYGARYVEDASAAANLKRDLYLGLVRLHGGQREQADDIARSTHRIGSPPFQADVLVALAIRGEVSTEAVVDGLRKIEGAAAPRERHRVLLDLVQRRGADAVHADRIAESTAYIGDDRLETEVLLALVRRGEVSTKAALSGLAGVSDAGSRARYRADVLLALARQRATRRDDAERIASWTPKIDDDRLESEVLVLLARAEQAAVREVLCAADDIDITRSAPQYRADVLVALARRALLDQRDADRIAEAAGDLGSDKLAADVLVPLAGRASREAMDEAAARLVTQPERERVERALGGGS